MFISKKFCLILGLFATPIIWMTPSHCSSELSQMSDLSIRSSSTSSSVKDILEGYHVNLEESKNPTANLPAAYLKKVEPLLSKKSPTSEDEEELGSLFITASDAFNISENDRDNFIVEGIRHYQNAAILGNISTVRPIASLLRIFRDDADPSLIKKLGGEGNLSKAIIAIYKLALDCGDTEAEAAYEYEQDMIHKS